VRTDEWTVDVDAVLGFVSTATGTRAARCHRARLYGVTDAGADIYGRDIR
jgi:hypothetical protein